MKQLAKLLAVGALLALILLPVTIAVNTHNGNDGPRAEGVAPAPPWPPAEVVLAEGVPAPPWPPAEVVLAEGVPAPPWPPAVMAV